MARAEDGGDRLSLRAMDAQPCGPVRRDDEETLKRAYHDRVRNLGVRLQGGQAGAGNGAPPLRCEGGGEGGTQDTEQQVERLIQAIRGLCQERRGLRREIEAADRKHQGELAEVRAEVERHVREHAEMAQEESQLRRKLAHADTEHLHECASLERLRDEDTGRLDAEAEKLGSDCQAIARRLSDVQAEAEHYQRSIRTLIQERSVARQNTVAAVNSQKVVEAELQHMRVRLKQSEAETDALADKCSSVGERFEHVIEVSERETEESLCALRDKAQSAKRKIEKQRRRLDDAEAKLVKATAITAQHEEALMEQDAEILHLRHACQAERDIVLKREQELYESQRRVVQEQTLELQKLGGMMPVSSHQQIIQERREQHQAAVAGLEATLKQQLRLQEESFVRAIQDRDLLCGETGDVDTTKDDLTRKVKHMESDVRAAQEALERIGSQAATSEEQRSAHAIQLEAASSKITLLKSALSAERSAHCDAEASIADARMRHDSLRKAAIESGEATAGMLAGLGPLDSLQAAQNRHIRTLGDEIGSMQGRDRQVALKLTSLLEQQCEMKARLLSTQQRSAQADAAKSSLELVAQLQREGLVRLQCALHSFRDGHSHSGQLLKQHVREQQQSLLADVRRAGQQWQLAIDTSALGDPGGQDHLDSWAQAAGPLEERLRAIHAANGRLQRDAACLAETVAVEGRASERLGSAAQTAVARAERLVACVGSALPGVRVPEGLLGGAGTLAATPDTLAALGASLSQGMALARDSAVSIEVQRWAPRLEESRAQHDSRQRAVLVEANTKRYAVEERLEALEVELCPLHAVAKDADVIELDEWRRDASQWKTCAEQAEIEARFAAQDLQLAKAELQERAHGASAASAEARQAAVRPLQQEILEASVGLEVLRERFKSDLSRRELAREEEMEWRERERDRAIQRRAALRTEEVSKLRRALDELRVAGCATTPRQQVVETRLHAELRAARGGLRDAHAEAQRLDGLQAAAERAARSHLDATAEVKLQLSACESQRRAAADAADEERLVDEARFAEALAQLRCEGDVEVLHAEAELRQSLSDLSAISAEGDEALAATRQLEASAARLAERARIHLGL